MISLYLKSSLLLFAFILLFSSFSCTSGSFWGYDLEEITELLDRGQYSFLVSVELKDSQVKEVKKLGKGAAYYLGLIYEKLGYPTRSTLLLGLEAEQGDEPWRSESRKKLLRSYLDSGRYQATEQFSLSLDPELGTFEFRALIEAWYWQHKDHQVLEALSLHETATADPGFLKDPELLLFRAASAARLGCSGWDDHFRDLFFNIKASSLHVRAYDFLSLEEAHLNHFTEDERRIFYGKNLIPRNEPRQALGVLESVKDLAWYIDYPILIDDFYHAYWKSRYYSRGIDRFAMLVQRLREETGTAALQKALEKRAMLLRFSERHEEAAEVFRESFFLARGCEQERMLWYVLSSHVRSNPSKTARELEAYVKLWKDPSYYADIFDELAGLLITRRDWQGLHAVLETLKSYGPERAVGQYGYLTGRAVESGLLKNAGFEAHEYYTQAFTAGDGRYYHLLSALKLGIDPAELLPDQELIIPGTGLDTHADLLFRGYLTYDLLEEAFKLSRTLEIKDEYRFFLAQKLAGKENWSDSMRTLYYLQELSDREPTLEELRYLYPLAWEDEVRASALEEGISPALFYGLVREESYFDPEIRSSAGAVGLSQLMPTTALEAGAKIGITQPRLSDPEENLLIGSFYLANLLDRVDGAAKGLFAYNAGLTRVRRWDIAFGDLPADLYLEAVPFAETRNYGKKVISSALYYEMLYPQQSTGGRERAVTALISLIFPDFFSEPF
jgi:soluble lytic murein transglycosylase-like protein